MFDNGGVYVLFLVFSDLTGYTFPVSLADSSPAQSLSAGVVLFYFCLLVSDLIWTLQNLYLQSRILP